jgi:hypothetical protein
MRERESSDHIDVIYFGKNNNAIVPNYSEFFSLAIMCRLPAPRSRLPNSISIKTTLLKADGQSYLRVFN